MSSMMGNRPSAALRIAALAAGLLAPGLAQGVPPPPPPPPLDVAGDDLFLVATSVAPNVILLMDNSASMDHIEWHPAFDPFADPDSYGCDDWDNDLEYVYATDANGSHCGSTNRTIYAPSDDTIWTGRYLNWYFGLAGTDPILDEIENAVAAVEGCTQAGGAAPFAEKYRRTRFEATKQVLLDLLCVAETKNVRFGVAFFRANADAEDPSVDPNGGWIKSDLGRANPSHAAELESAIKLGSIAGETPLAESLFQIYTFWMSRDPDDLPLGLNATKFPPYHYDKFGDPAAEALWLEDPMLYPCEKAFVVIVTDGLPTRDDFDSDPDETSEGFDNFVGLIGDYHDDGEVEDFDDATDPDERSFYLDDISKYMYDKDFRPDLDDDQTIDTYTIGLRTDAATSDFLQKTADVGNGLFFSVKDGDELAFALIEALNDIIEKSASFTAASVPSARTKDGGDFYQSYFFPRGKTAFWEGHIRAWHVTASGDVTDKNDDCALLDTDAGECNSGPFSPDAEFFWDASDEVPAPSARTLYVSTSSNTAGALPPSFDASLDASDLRVLPFDAPPDPAPNSIRYPVFGSTALNEEGLADEIVAYARGCFLGSGVETSDVDIPMACLARPARLGDIFHSNPVVVRHPSRLSNEESYKAFKQHYEGRDRILYTGTNAGFLEAIHAGDWDTSLTPPRYDEGTGTEVFGFMPWEARRKIKRLPIDPPLAREHYVDGDPQVADVWMYPSSTAQTKNANGSEWRTVLAGSLREGGHHFYALDITNPDGINAPGGGPLPYPGYLWEFPSLADPDGDLDWMGETWGRPVMTRVRVKINCATPPCDVYERWVAIATSGYDAISDPNPEEVSGVTASYDETNGQKGRAIYIIDVKSGEVLAEKRFDASASDAQADMKYALVGTPAVFDLDFDGYADVIYAVDLGGQVFKWVIHAVGEDRVNDGQNLRTQPSWPFKLFFQAPIENIDGDDYYKNLFFPPAGTFIDGKLFIAFGSGERRSLPFPGIADEDENNRFYVINDPDPYEIAATPFDTFDEDDLTDITNDEDGATFTNQGFFFKVSDGDKFVTNVEIFAGHVIAASFKPTDTGDPCTSRGDGTLHVFGIQNGEGYFRDDSDNPMRGISVGAGLPTDPKVSVGVGGTNNRVYIEKSGADLESFEEDDVDAGGRWLYWRERF